MMCIDKILLLILTVIISTNFSFGQIKSRHFGKSTEITQINGEEPSGLVNIDVYPNPASYYLNVDITNAQLKNVEFEVYNIIGNVMQVKAEKTSEGKYKILVKDYVPGYYLLVIKDDYSRFKETHKILKQ